MTTALRLLCILALVAAPLSSRAARAADDSEPPSIVHEEVKSARLGAPVVIAATIKDPSGVFDPVLLYRLSADGGELLRLPMTPQEGSADVYQAVIPGDVVSGDLEYFIEAFDENGNGPARYADADLPVKVTVLKTAEPVADDGAAAGAPEEEGGAGLWIALGVVAVGLVVVAAAGAAGVAAFVLLSPPAPPSRVDVVVRGPTPVAATAVLP